MRAWSSSEPGRSGAAGALPPTRTREEQQPERDERHDPIRDIERRERSTRNTLSVASPGRTRPRVARRWEPALQPGDEGDRARGPPTGRSARPGPRSAAPRWTQTDPTCVWPPHATTATQSEIDEARAPRRSLIQRAQQARSSGHRDGRQGDRQRTEGEENAAALRAEPWTRISVTPRRPTSTTSSTRWSPLRRSRGEAAARKTSPAASRSRCALPRWRGRPVIATGQQRPTVRPRRARDTPRSRPPR